MNPRKLYFPPLCNIGDDLKVCIQLPNNYFSTLEECVKASVAAFWSTKFEDSMYGAYVNYKPNSLLGDARKWQKKTKKNPEWVPKKSLKVYKEELFKDFRGIGFDPRQEKDDDD